MKISRYTVLCTLHNHIYTGNSSTRRYSQLTFIVKAIYSVNAGTFVVTPQQEEVLWVFYFVGQQEADSFKRLFASINIVS